MADWILIDKFTWVQIERQKTQQLAIKTSDCDADGILSNNE